MADKKKSSVVNASWTLAFYVSCHWFPSWLEYLTHRNMPKSFLFTPFLLNRASCCTQCTWRVGDRAAANTDL